MTRLLVVAILAGALALPVAMPAQAPARPPVRTAPVPVPDIAYQKFTLKNGLTLLVHEDHKAA